MKIKFAFLVFVPLLFLAGCKTQSHLHSSEKTHVDKDENIHSQMSEKELYLQNRFADAMRVRVLDDLPQALNLLMEIQKEAPENYAGKYEIGRIYFDMHKFDQALPYVQQAAKGNPDNIWYQKLYATCLSATANYKNAAEVYAGMAKKNPEDVDALMNEAWMFEQAKDYDNALKIYEAIEKKTGVNEEVLKEKEKLFLQQNKFNDAVGVMKQLIEINPSEAGYYTMLSQLYQSNKMNAEALEVMKDLMRVQPGNPQAILGMADYFRGKGMEDSSQLMLLKAFQSDEMDIDNEIRIILGFLPQLQIEKQKQFVFGLCEAMISKHPREAKAFAMYGDVFSQTDSAAKALAQYKKSIALDSGKWPVWQQLLFLELNLEMNDSLLVNSATAVNLFPDQMMAFYLNGMGNLLAKNYAAATKQLGRAVTMGTDSKKFAAQIYARMGEAYNSWNHAVQSDSCFELSLNLDPDNPLTLNNYAYYLSLRSSNLSKAEALSKKSNDLSPNNANYLDTYGWILYQQKNYSGAKEWLTKALQNGGSTNGTVLEHYGDVLFKLGDTNGAVENWIKAKQFHSEGEHIDRKIADKTLYE